MNEDEHWLLASEMRCYCNFQNIWWQEKVTNDDIWQTFRTETVVDIILQINLSVFGHMSNVWQLFIESHSLGTVQGTRCRGRPPKWRTDNITEWTWLKLCEAIHMAKVWKIWRNTTLGPYGHYITGRERENLDHKLTHSNCGILPISRFSWNNSFNHCVAGPKYQHCTDDKSQLLHMHLTYPTCISHLRCRWPRSSFAKIFGVRKLESLGYCVALFASSYV